MNISRKDNIRASIYGELQKVFIKYLDDWYYILTIQEDNNRNLTRFLSF